MDHVEDPPITPAPGEHRSRQLERPPSERFDTAEPTEAITGESPPFAHGLVAAVIAGIAGALVIAVGGGLFTITAGLLVIAGVVGWIVAVALTRGAGASTSTRGRTRATAALIALAAVAVGQVGLWLIARGEGGTLDLIDYLAEVFGVLVPAELLIAGVVAWWRAA
jgi:hypothetical protein